MDRLRLILSELGLGNVCSFIASGNLLFSSRSKNTADLEQKIERSLEAALGYEVATFVRSKAELHAISAHQPFPTTEHAAPGHGLYIAFLRAAPAAPCIDQLLTHRNNFDDFHVNDREVYWLCRGKFSDSPFTGSKLERTLKLPATVRNSTTLRKLMAAHFPV